MCISPAVNCPLEFDGYCLGRGMCCFAEQLSDKPYCICDEGFAGNRCERKNADYGGEYDYDEDTSSVTVTTNVTTVAVVCILALAIFLVQLSRNYRMPNCSRSQRACPRGSLIVFTVPDRNTTLSPVSSHSDLISLTHTIVLPSESDAGSASVIPSSPPVLVHKMALTSPIAESTSTGDVWCQGPAGSAVADGGVPPPSELLDVRY